MEHGTHRWGAASRHEKWNTLRMGAEGLMLTFMRSGTRYAATHGGRGDVHAHEKWIMGVGLFLVSGEVEDATHVGWGDVKCKRS